MSEPQMQRVRVLDIMAQAGMNYRPTQHFSQPCMVAETPNSLWDDGYHAATTEWMEERAAMQALVRSATALQPEASEELSALIAETVIGLVADIVGQVEINRDGLLRRIEQATAVITECDNARTIILHPLDVAALADAGLPFEILPDASAERGSIRIGCSPGWIEQKTSHYLDALHSALGSKERTL